MKPPDVPNGASRRGPATRPGSGSAGRPRPGAGGVGIETKISGEMNKHNECLSGVCEEKGTHPKPQKVKPKPRTEKRAAETTSAPRNLLL